jgi:hypothetical protein
MPGLLQSRHSGPVYQFNTPEASGTASNTPAWHLSLTQDWSSFVVVKRERNSHGKRLTWGRPISAVASEGRHPSTFPPRGG